MNKAATYLETAVLGGGCFWCTEAAYQLVEGVTDVMSGYAGGHIPNPSYERVASQTTGHAEVVQLTFDPDIITYAELLEIFWVIHDPTTKNRQNYDEGPAYRSIILYADDSQKRTAELSREEAQAYWPDPIVTEIVALEGFYPAEERHQNFYRNNPAKGYCQVIINPKLAKLRREFANRLKKETV